MIAKHTLIAVAATLVATAALAQAPQTVHLRGTIEKLDGNTLTAKSDKGDELKIKSMELMEAA